MRKLIFSLLLLALSMPIASAQQFDLVLAGGRVMDPETGVDAVRNVGIRDGKIVRITSEALSGRRVVHASGLVVAPGFIDLHQHGQDLNSQRVKALDGVTTALELEIGAPDVAQFLKAKEGHSLIHYGSSASHATPEQIESMRNRLQMIWPSTGANLTSVKRASQRKLGDSYRRLQNPDTQLCWPRDVNRILRTNSTNFSQDDENCHSEAQDSAMETTRM